MSAGNWTLTNSARTKILNGQFDLDSDSFKIGLLQSTSNIGIGSTTWAGVTNEVANGLGYTTGGIAVSLGLSGTTSVTADPAVDPVWTAAGGSIVARWAAIYEVGGDVLAFCLLEAVGPADVTTTDTNTLTIAHPTGLLVAA